VYGLDEETTSAAVALGAELAALTPGDCDTVVADNHAGLAASQGPVTMANPS
jgi:hypothetical protein